MVTLIYDGDCPLCRQYVTRLRVHEAAGPLELIDARTDSVLVNELLDAGKCLDEGLVARVGAEEYHGHSALHVLALMSTRAGWFNRINYRIFGSANRASGLYPFLVGGRGLLLRLLRRTPIRSAEHFS